MIRNMTQGPILRQLLTFSVPLLLANRVYPTRENIALFPFRRQLHAACWQMWTQG